MKLLYCVQQKIEIDNMQFRFMNFRVNGNKLYFGFVYLEKAFDGVLYKVEMELLQITNTHTHTHTHIRLTAFFPGHPG